MDSKENLLGVLETGFRWKKQILRVLAVTLVGSVVITLLMSNYYKANTLFYAASQDLAKPAAVGPTPFTPNYYGEGEDIDRILTIANSGELLDYLVHRFDLYQHYEIDTTKVKAPYLVRNALMSHYNVIQTKYDAIDLSIEDTDPELAAAMANAAREKIEDIGRRLVKSSMERQVTKYESMIGSKEKQILVIDSELKMLRDSYNIYYTGMGEGLAELSTGLETQLSGLEASRRSIAGSKTYRNKRDTLPVIDARIEGLKEKKKKLDERLNKFTSGIGQVEMLTRLHSEARGQLGLDKETLKQIQTAHDADFPILILVEEATVPVIKSRPKRSLFVLGALVAALIFSIVSILLIEQYRDVNWQKIING